MAVTVASRLVVYDWVGVFSAAAVEREPSASAEQLRRVRVVADHRVILASRFPNDDARRSTVVEHTMDVQSWLPKQLEDASPDLLRAMVKDFAEALMGDEVDALCGAGYGERSPERVNRRNGLPRA